MNKDLGKLVDASDDELFKGLNLSPKDAKVFEQGARHLFGEPSAPDETPVPLKAPDIRAHTQRTPGPGDIRPKP